MGTQPASAELINNSYKVMSIAADQSRGVMYSQRRSNGIVERLLITQSDPRNQAIANFRLREVRDALSTDGQRKAGKEVVITYRRRNNYGAGTFDPKQACADAPTQTWLAKSFFLDKTITHAVEIDLNQWRCVNAGDENIAGTLIAEAIEDLTDKFSNDLELEIYANHIGSLPSKIGGVGQTPRPFSKVNVFRANGVELNEAAPLEFMADMRLANVRNYFMIGGQRAMSYAEQTRATRINDRGTDFSVESMQAIANSQFFMSPIVAGVINPASFGTTGSPAVAIEDGAIYVASAPLYTSLFNRSVPQIANEPGKTRYSIPHPYLPGIFIDVVETVDTQCDDFYSFPRVKIQMGITYTVISRMSCEVDNGTFTKGVNGVFLYFLDCGDTGACDIEDYKWTPPYQSFQRDNKCETDVTCAADLACKVEPYVVGFQEVGDTIFAVFAASVKPSGGANNPTSYQWLLNGAPYSSTGTPTLLIDIENLTNGDVVSLAYEDSAECAQTVEFAPVDLSAQGVCGTLIASFDGNELADGDTIALGSFAQNSAQTIDIKLSALNFAIPVNTGVSGAVTSAALALAVTPVGTETNEVVVTLNTAALGANNGTFTITPSCGDALVITVTFTVV